MNSPQIPLSGTIGAQGNFALLLTGSIAFASDANRAMVYPETVAYPVTVTSGVSLTAQRDLIAPLIQGLYSFYNATTGSQSIRVIGASGTGAVIPNGQVGIVYCDGANYILASASGGVAAGPTGAIQYNSAGSLAGTSNAIVDSSGNTNVMGQLGVGLSRANTSHVIDSSGSSSSTTVTGANPVELRIANTDTTVNNYEGVAAAMTNSTPAVVTAGKLVWVNIAHTAAAESADLHFLLRNAGTLTDWFTLFHDGGLAAAGVTGGDKGAGTINASLYQNGTALGTMSIQNASAVAITGGTIDATTVGLTTPAAGTFTRILLSSGSAGTPSLAFSANPGLGAFFNSSLVSIDFVASGIAIFRVRTSGIAVDVINPLNGGTIALRVPVAQSLDIQTGNSATSGGNITSPSLSFNGQIWTGSTSSPALWKIQNVVGPGTAPACTLTFTPPTNAPSSPVALPNITLNASHVITGVQGTTGANLAATSGSFTNGNLRSTNATGDEVDAGVAAAAVVAVGGSFVALSQTTGTGAVTLVTPASNSMWRISANVTCVTSSAAATVTLTVTWTDTSNTVQTATIGTATATTLGAASQTGGVLVIRAKSGTAIQVQGAISGTPTFDISATAEKLTNT